MDDKRQLYLSLLRFLPFATRDDFFTIGFFLWAGDDGFKEVRFAQDSRLLRYVASNVEEGWFQTVTAAISDRLKTEANRKAYEEFIGDNFGACLDVAPAKAVLSQDPRREMEALTLIHLAPMSRVDVPLNKSESPSRTGRPAIVREMKKAFETAGVLSLLQKEMDMRTYTGAGDPFRMDFGYCVNGEMKMFHGVSLAASVDQALALAYRYSRIEIGMRQGGLRSSLMAVVEDQLAMDDERTRFAIDTMQNSGVLVNTLSEIGQITSRIQTEMSM